MDAQAIIHALAGKVGFEAINFHDTGAHLRILGRVPQQRMKEHLALIKAICLHTKGGAKGWSADISKLYFTPQDEVVFVWRFIFETSLEALPYEDIISVVGSSRTATAAPGNGPLGDEIPLGHVNPNRHAPKGGKGAAPMGKARVGPALNQGGGS